MIVAIAAAEIAFWVFLVAGLLTRYVARRERASRALLLCVPLVDVLLLVFVVVDVAGGAPPSTGHALAAVYLGATVMFGRSVVEWVDVRLRHRFAGGPAPAKPAKGSREAVRALWVEWFRVVGTVVIAAPLVLVMIAVRGVAVPTSLDAASASPYWGSLLLMAVVTGIWFAAGPAFAGRGRVEPDRVRSR